MHTQLAVIFEIRKALLKRCNLQFYRLNDRVIHNSSLAAQDLYYSGDLSEYDSCNMHELSNDAMYASLHAAYNIPYKSSDSRCVNPGLVLDLARALKADIDAGIVGRVGEVIAPEKLEQSQILQTYHNTDDSGVPVSALKRMSKNARECFIRMYQKPLVR